MPSRKSPIILAFLAVAVTAALVGVLTSMVGLTRFAVGAPSHQREFTNQCTAAVTKTIQPASIRLCEQSEVTVGVRPSCPGLAVNIVIIVDEVYKIGYSNPADRTEALRSAIDRLGVTKQGNINVGVVFMQNGRAVTKVPLTTDMHEVIGQLNVPMISRFEAQPQCFECGYREAVKMFDGYVKDHPDSDVREITILVPMGVYTEQARPGIVRGANLAKARGATSISGCYAWTHCVPELKQAASEARLYLPYGQGSRLAGLLYEVVRQTVVTTLREVTLIDTYPAAVTVITDSVAPPPALDAQARSLTWAFAEPFVEAYTVTYRVKPLVLGTHKMGDGAYVRLVDSHSLEATVAVPVPVLEVPVVCQNPPTATPPPTPTDTPTAAPTASPTIAPTNTPTPTNTPRPMPVYLPVGLDEECVPARTYADVALVFDLSTTMREVTPDGRAKIAVVLDAARSFLSRMSLAPESANGDRVAVVGFNSAAWIEQPLTGQRDALESALDRLPAKMRELTRLDLAMTRGAEALAERDREANMPVLVLLTDGLPNQVPYAEDGSASTTILRAANAVKAAGVTVYTIGVGRQSGPRPQVNPALLRAVASRPDMYYAAPDAAQLADIYAQLWRTIPCGGQRYWPNR